jgi:GNAT superfamily N-acetyltransferase
MISIKEPDKIEIRLFDKKDNLSRLTSLLNRCYKPLADMGFRYLSSYQDAFITQKRIENAVCLAAYHEKKLVGTISYYSVQHTFGNEWYDQDFVASYGQFAVEREYQGKGIGGVLIEKVEELARKENVEELAVDTSEGAHHLIDFYVKRGYRNVGYTQWKETNYRSVLMSKKLKGSFGNS